MAEVELGSLSEKLRDIDGGGAWPHVRYCCVVSCNSCCCRFFVWPPLVDVSRVGRHSWQTAVRSSFVSERTTPTITITNTGRRSDRAPAPAISLYIINGRYYSPDFHCQLLLWLSSPVRHRFPWPFRARATANLLQPVLTSRRYGTPGWCAQGTATTVGNSSPKIDKTASPPLFDIPRVHAALIPLLRIAGQ